MTNAVLLGERLYELRKGRGLSQEELAERLGISRQAISKWECGESLPDTDNLIAISRLYGVSLDELVGNAPEKAEENAETEEAKVEEPDTEETDSIFDEDEDEPKGKKSTLVRVLYAFPYPVAATIAFLLWGILAGGWHIAWTLFITVPIYYSLVDCIRARKLSCFAYPVFAAFAYLLMGMAWGLWHPYWIIFITIPIYYSVAEAFDKR